MKNPDLPTIYLLLSIAGCLLAVYWSFTLSHDPSSRFVAWPVLFARRACLLSMGFGMLMSVSYAWDRGWEPWPPYIFIIGSLDLYLLVSIITAHIRNKICGKCPLTDMGMPAIKAMKSSRPIPST